jgi:zinc-binding alcohol dehydrogenase family protein
MKAVGYRESLPIDNPKSLEDLEIPVPELRAHDLLVRVQAVSVNPADTKVRKNRKPGAKPEILGWDAVGTVEKVGPEVKNFQVGDRVYYAGSINRPGTNSELHAVDERIVARAPKSVSDAEAAALPLTTLTAYELLFHRLRVPQGGGKGQSLLVVGGAGGVGSILIQIARQLTQLSIIATASRAETRQWCLDLGAHAVIDHREPLDQALKAAGVDAVDYVAALTQTERHYPAIVKSLKPQGALGVIDDMKDLDIMQLKEKSISLHWELMFTRPLFETPDMQAQGDLLAEIAEWVDAGRIRTTANSFMGTINAEHMRRAHALVESGRAQGKVVLAGF